ncbi:MAG: AbgT family transporter [Phycisphaerales bacterium]|nr:AbgT family transporter [Planctomycetota bacterium]MCH8508675.1 AbgT family transporter [Phycisphaerales bacterium]
MPKDANEPNKPNESETPVSGKPQQSPETDGDSAPPPPEDPARTGWFGRFLSVVEWLGNLLPHPVSLFALFAAGVVLVSGIARALGVSVADPRPEGTPGRAESGTIEVFSLMSGDGFRYIVENLVTNFTGFVPLGTVLVALLGVGVAERSGLLSAVIRGMVLAAPKQLVTMVIVLAGVLSNTASEMGYVVLVPLAATIFHAMGRHPLAGLAAAFAGVSGGYSANLLIGTVDPLLAGITEEAARFLDPAYEVHPAVNWYFMIGSTFLITFLGTWVTSRIVEPRLGKYDATRAEEDVERNPSMSRLNADEKRGLWHAAIGSVVVAFGILWIAGPMPGLFAGSWFADWTGWGVLRNPETGGLLPSPMLRGVVAMILVFFFVPGVLYGRTVGTIRNDRDVINAMADTMGTMGLYIVLVFFAAQFVAFFRESNLGMIVAVVGADTLRAIGLDNPLVFIPFILMCCFVNLMLGSASAQWAVTAPIFVPMLMSIGYSPEVIQAAYRIGDSSTNIITPMMSYFGLILAFATKYDKKLGIGTLMSTMLPYCIYFLIGWMIFFYLWVFILGIPVGPGAPTYYTPPGV